MDDKVDATSHVMSKMVDRIRRLPNGMCARFVGVNSEVVDTNSSLVGGTGGVNGGVISNLLNTVNVRSPNVVRAGIMARFGGVINEITS